MYKLIQFVLKKIRLHCCDVVVQMKRAVSENLSFFIFGWGESKIPHHDYCLCEANSTLISKNEVK